MCSLQWSSSSEYEEGRQITVIAAAAFKDDRDAYFLNPLSVYIRLQEAKVSLGVVRNQTILMLWAQALNNVNFNLEMVSNGPKNGISYQIQAVFYCPPQTCLN